MNTNKISTSTHILCSILFCLLFLSNPSYSQVSTPLLSSIGKQTRKEILSSSFVKWSLALSASATSAYGLSFVDYDLAKIYLWQNDESSHQNLRLIKKNFLPLPTNSWLASVPTIERLFLQESYSDKEKKRIREGKKVFVVISHQKDIDLLNNLFAKAGQLPVDVQSFLQKELQESFFHIIKVPLQTFLPLFIQDKIYTYEDQHGPNCFHAALSFHQEQDASAQKEDKNVTASEMLATLKENFLLVDQLQEPKYGDMLVFCEAEGTKLTFEEITEKELVHACVYIHDEIVFTKNGYSRFSPYLFQEKKTNIKLYHNSPKKSRLFIFRKNSQL